MVKDEKDLAIGRLKIRSSLLEYLSEYVFLSLPSASALPLLQQILEELQQKKVMTFPRLGPDMSMLASEEVEKEISHLIEFFTSVYAKILSNDGNEA